MRKQWLCLLCCLICCLALGIVAEASFNDTEGHWAEETIEKWHDRGQLNGYPDGSFKPDYPITRAEFAKIITDLFDLKGKEQSSYEDIMEESWYYYWVQSSARYIPTYPLPTLYESNIPYHENVLNNRNWFLPNEKAIRMHVAEALVEIKLEKEPMDIETLSIQEINAQVQAEFKDAEYSNLMAVPGSGIPQNVQRMNKYAWLAHKLGIMEGDTEGNFSPYGYMTRAELITAIDRMVE